MWANPDVLTFYKTLDNYKYIPLGPINRHMERKKDTIKKKSVFKSKLMMEKPLMNIC